VNSQLDGLATLTPLKHSLVPNV